ncbi:FecR domain-containing protein [Brevundimonas sp.]|uniref:FecR family protein n=1 Tax=Brevundimonas sp. TaxID=1871086 RepID=UPI002897AE52|nr:FecR domain-containing protein [Brevundimonas sp.]
MKANTDIDEKALHWFVALRDEAAGDDVWFGFQSWLEASPAHALAYDAVERLWVDLDAADTAPVVAPQPAPVIDFAAARDRRAQRRRPWLGAGLGVAASVTLAVGLWMWMAPNGQTYATTDAPMTVALEDGSHVYLNRHSRLDVRFDGDRRAVSLAEGEAAFDVVHDPAHPFVVAAGAHQVEVLGTAFNVLNHGDDFAVAVERGVVAVTPAKAPKVRLTAGQALTQTAQKTPALAAVAPERASAWRQGVLVYRDRPLGDVADDLSRYLDKPVVLSTSARALRFTGALRIGDEAVMLQQLQDFLPIRIDASANAVRVDAREAG